MTRTYSIIGRLSVLVGVTFSGLILLASLGLLGSMTLGAMSLWPYVVLTIVASVFIASWAFAKAKGRAGWWGILLPFLDVIGFKILFKLEDRDRQRHEP